MNHSREKLTIVSAGLVVVILLFIVGLTQYINGRHSEIDLISNQDWSHFPGSQMINSSVHIKPLNLEITHHDTSASQPNPPVNIRGPHLRVAGDFQIEAKMSGIDNGASLELYGQPPIIYDEWRQERASLRVDVFNNHLSMRIWDGGSSTSNDVRSFDVSLKNTATITLLHKHGQIIMLADRRILGSMPDHNIFAHQTVWFGADATYGSKGWTLSSLHVRSLGKGHVQIVSSPPLADSHDRPNALRNLAAAQPRNLPIGAAVSIYPMFSDEAYRKIALGQFSMLTPEDSMKPEFIHPTKNVYSYDDADTLVDTALKNQMLVHGHALVSDKSNPNWMLQTSKSERKQTMIDHITAVVSHFRGRVAEWDVVNEPLSEEDIDYSNGNLGLRQDLWSYAMGESYIDVALSTARAADPSAKLYLNDYGLEKNGLRWDALVSLIGRLQQRGTPIDGVGFESHVYHNKDLIDPAVLKEHIHFLASLGIVSRISEVDVLGDDPAVQAQQYSAVLKICLQEPTCTSYSTWGVSDLYGSTTLSDRYPPVLGDSLLWNDKMMPKPAVSSLRNTLINAK